ncbi:MAG TPA: hypothetical protein DD850_13425 [Erwinia persicina]|nr:hypothetical protein [Erwinia persicina]HBQ80270.1 hypothetical protein [Erwinia persicina]HBT14489.1 hypothetical protein [Erwinia persicina]HBT31119.1 hypothetical protein [Erwinia persicina]HBT54782.1 hypothetical protein [Erwinia persicina]
MIIDNPRGIFREKWIYSFFCGLGGCFFNNYPHKLRSSGDGWLSGERKKQGATPPFSYLSYLYWSA